MVPLAEIFSDFNGDHDEIHGVGADGVFRCSVHHLDRDDETIVSRPAVEALAKFLIAFRDVE